MSGPRLQFRVEHEEAEVRLAVSGELDLRTADALLEAGRNLLSQSPPRLVLDLAGVPFCDSMGLSALVALKRASDSVRCTFVIEAPQPVVAETLAISGLEEYLGVPAAHRRIWESDPRPGR